MTANNAGVKTVDKDKHLGLCIRNYVRNPHDVLTATQLMTTTSRIISIKQNALHILGHAKDFAKAQQN